VISTLDGFKPTGTEAPFLKEISKKLRGFRKGMKKLTIRLFSLDALDVNDPLLAVN
jgi:hypothetical protein